MPADLSRIAAAERVDVASLVADRRARAVAYAEPKPAWLAVSSKDLRDGAEAAVELLRQAKALGLVIVEGGA